MALELVDFETIAETIGLKKEEENYPALSIMINSVSSMFENYTRRYFSPTKYTAKIPMCAGEKMIPLKALPVEKVLSILIDNTEVEYSIEDYGLCLSEPTKKDNSVAIVYKGGLKNIPEDIASAALLQIIFMWQNKESIGVKSVRTNGGNTTKESTGLLYLVTDILDKHIHPFPIF